MPVFSAVLDPQLYEADIKHCTLDLLRTPVLTLAALEGRTGSLRRWCVGESGVSGLQGIGCSAPF